MNIKKFINLSNTATKILKKYKNFTSIVAIRQLHMMRPHPVLLKEYYDLNKSKEKGVDSKNILSHIIDLIKHLFSENNVFYFKNKIEKINNQNVDCLFLTHLINEKHIGQKNDFYFGELPNFLEKKKFKCVKIYRNLTDRSSLTIFKKNKSKLGNSLILSKSLSLFDEIRLCCKIINSFLLVSKLKYKDKNIKKFFSKNTFKFVGSSYNNLRLLRQVNLIAKKYTPKFFFLTLEGHAWEKLIINELRKNFPKTKILTYQFSIVTKYSRSLYLNLGRGYMPDLILTSGNFTKNEFRKKLSSKINIINIGSNKFSKKNQIKKNNDILVIPEGFNSETLKMFNFVMKAAIKFKNKKFIFRFHPMINSSEFFKDFFKRDLKLPSNLIISNKNFDQDILNSKYIIYRGSAAAIQGLGSQKIVIYLEFSNEINIDPLYMLKKKFYVNRLSHLEKIFYNKKNIKENYKNVLFTREYFGETNYKNLINYLNT